jgi:hypothetical protein
VDVKGSAEQALVRYDFGTGGSRHCNLRTKVEIRAGSASLESKAERGSYTPLVTRSFLEASQRKASKPMTLLDQLARIPPSSHRHRFRFQPDGN